MSARGLNLLVFRDGRRRVSGAGLKSALMAQLVEFSDASPKDLKLGALLCAGELECAIADALFDCSPCFARLSDVLAEAFLAGQLTDHFQNTKEAVAQAPVPENVTVSTPEGFAYYALQPSAYAQVLDRLPLLPERVVVIGIRSIGATLSAVTAAAARLRGSQAIRFTVRPAGHPYNRGTEFLPNQLHIIQRGIAGNACFLIVDEGPGLSGSSFLSVAEALEVAGVAREKIILLSAHEPNPETLCSTNAAQRWRRFRCVPVASEPFRPTGAGAFVGGGEWRSGLFHDESEWPAVWSNMERVKYLATENREDRGGKLLKFVGLGHYGGGVLEREKRVAEAGFAPMPRPEENGFVSYPWLNSRPMVAADLSHDILIRLAEYCAFRAKAFSISGANIRSLQEMVDHNLAEFGFDLPVALKLERPVVADGRMQPHEWIMSSESKLLKTDCGSHGDDHFYPGPTDIAWDLAGAIVEWRMNVAQSAEFLRLYSRTIGDDPSARITDYIHAYTVFRCAYCKMAANAMQGTAEQVRLDRATSTYAALLESALEAAQRTMRSEPATLFS